MAIKISPDRNTEIQEKAAQDAREGKYDPPEGNVAIDTIFAIPDLLAGTPSTTEVAKEEKHIYDAAHEQTKKP